MTGRTVTIPTEVTKVGTNYPAINQILFMLGAADRLVANDKGIPALIISVFNDPEQLKTGVRLIADVLGGDAPAQADRFAAYYDGNVARAAATADIPQPSRPKGYYTASGPLVTEGKGSIVTTWMEQGGGRNIAAENGISAPPTFATVTLEDVLSWNSDVIICRDAATRQEILQDARWRTVAVVRNDRVIANPSGVFVWSVRSGESALQPLWAAKTFHPDRFADLDRRDPQPDPVTGRPGSAGQRS